MAISTSIKALIAGEQVAGSKISNKLLEELLTEGLLLVSSRGSRKSYRARNIETLKRFLIDKDECYRVLEIETSDSRASMAIKTGNSKLVAVRSCPGFPVNSYEPIECLLSGKQFLVNPQEGSYTNYLFDKGEDKILKKVGEEAAEVVIAGKNRAKDEISYEVADLMYHLTVMLADNGMTWEDIFDELEKRR